MQYLLDIALASLPHGPEFRFLDRLIELDPGISGSGEYEVKADTYFLRGHFPNQPIMPGVLMIEALAQLAGTVAQSGPKPSRLSNLRLAALRTVKIPGSAAPGQTLRLQARVTGRLGNLIQAAGAIRADNKLVLEAELTLSGDLIG